MKCPHCTTGVNENWGSWNVLVEQPPSPHAHETWQLWAMVCPECGELIAQVRRLDGTTEVFRTLAWPKFGSRPLPPEVTGRWSEDFSQAAEVIGSSPKASAALSRRLLQDIIREKAGVTNKDLATEIQTLIDSGNVPTWLSENLDSVRAVGNFAAHPIKSTNTGEVVGVEPVEAEFLLDVLEGMFDFYFVQPERARQNREALNQKLADAGKPELNVPDET
jgi:hypothetical protein